MGIDASSGEADVSIRAHQDQRVSRDAVGTGGMSVVIDQDVVGDGGRAACARNAVGAQGAIGDIGQRWHGLLTENEQGEVRAPEEVEEPHLLTACGIDTRCVIPLSVFTRHGLVVYKAHSMVRASSCIMTPLVVPAQEHPSFVPPRALA